MRVQVTVRHGSVNDSVRSYVETKLGKLGRRLPPEAAIEVVLDRERNPKIVDDHVVEAEILLKGANIIGREAGPTYEVAADLLVDSLGRQIERRRDKRVQEPRRRAAEPPHEVIPVEEIERAVRASTGEQAT
jgi:putative sigma-54 modulation protein